VFKQKPPVVPSMEGFKPRSALNFRRPRRYVGPFRFDLQLLHLGSILPPTSDSKFTPPSLFSGRRIVQPFSLLGFSLNMFLFLKFPGCLQSLHRQVFLYSQMVFDSKDLPFRSFGSPLTLVPTPPDEAFGFDRSPLWT